MTPALAFGLALSALFFGAGLVALGWPERVQRFVLSHYSDVDQLESWRPIFNWMRSSSYIVSIRITGALAMIAGCVVVSAMIKRAS
jgi:hypothetical protein